MMCYCSLQPVAHRHCATIVPPQGRGCCVGQSGLRLLLSLHVHLYDLRSALGRPSTRAGRASHPPLRIGHRSNKRQSQFIGLATPKATLTRVAAAGFCYFNENLPPQAHPPGTQPVLCAVEFGLQSVLFSRRRLTTAFWARFLTPGENDV